MQKFNRYALLFSIVLILLLSLFPVYAVGDSDGSVSGLAVSDDSVCLLFDSDGSVSGLAVSDDSVSDLGKDYNLMEETAETDSRNINDFASVADDYAIGNDDSQVVSSDSSSGLGSRKLGSSSVLMVSKGSSVENVYYVDSGNLSAFFEGNVLKEEYGNSTLVFGGNFDNLGVLKFYSNNTRVTAKNALFYNTVFDLSANGIVLSNLNIDLDKEFEDNHQAGIFLHGDNLTVYNCTLNYNAPDNVTAFGIYSNGYGEDFVGLKLMNNTINFKSRCLGDNDYGYGIFLRNTHDSLLSGNKVDCELPIKYINYAFYGTYGAVSRDTDAAIACDYCENLTLSGNYIHSSVNGGSNFYPTLDTVVMYGCSNSLIENNRIASEDFFTQVGNDNYLYALDLHHLDDVTVISNTISVFTNGGKSGMGAAYPIQINGPVDHVKIVFNNLTSFNRGPNCGIFSQNFYGGTFIDIISNFINVTGNASVGEGAMPSYCLVTGIEAQDSGDNILNNTIIVSNIGDYKSNANVYGISYVQNTGGGHTYNIQYNNITTNGNYAVKLIGDIKNSTTYNSTVSNNVFNTQTTSNRIGASTNRQVEGPSGTNIKNNTNGNPKNTMSEDYYPEWLKDYVRYGSAKGTGDFAWINRALNSLSNGTGFSEDVGNGTGSWGSGNSSGTGHGSHDGDVSGRGNNSESSSVNGNLASNSSSGVMNGDLNSSLTSPGVGGESLPSSSMSSSSDAGSSAANPNAYEIDEKDNSVVKSADNLQLAIICLIALLLLLLGYKRQKDKEEEE